MEDINKKIEIEEQKRKRQLAILKASNQLLQETMENMLEKESDAIERDRLTNEFKQAIDENKFKAKTYLNSTEEDIENAEFREVSQEWVDKYNKRLEMRGMTDEDMHEKSSAVLKIGKKEENGLNRRRRRKKNQNENDDIDEIQRLENEEELMNKTRVKSDDEIIKNIEKNQEEDNRKRQRKNDPIDNAIDNLVEIAKEEKIDTNNVKEEIITQINNTFENVPNTLLKKKKKKFKKVDYDFDFSTIPSYVQYDVITLPSYGQCYPIDSPLRCGKIAVAYLTAADENVITSPNLYRDGKVIDMILSRKIIDKRIKVSDLCCGDRDAIILWLRATSYGTNFPIITTNPNSGKKYDINVDLSDFNYFDFNLEGDDYGLFDYTTKNGDIIKFKMFTKTDEDELKEILADEVTDVNGIEIIKNVGFIKNSFNNINLTDEEKEHVLEDLDEIIEIITDKMDDFNEDKLFTNAVTEQMIKHTVSVNGNKDPEYIKGFIENMRVMDSLEYRNYFNENKPGVDFTITVNVPESDGGGSFTTFLRFDDYVFLNT